MPISRTCKMQGIVLEKDVAQESYRIIKEKLELHPHGLPGEIRTLPTDRSYRLGVMEMINSLLVNEPGDFIITGVELLNGNQLQFDVSWLIVLGDEAVNQL